jgi:N-acetylneuraminate lyase
MMIIDSFNNIQKTTERKIAMIKNTLPDIKGVIPALITPFKEDGAIYEPALRNLVDHLIESGVGGFYITGSTGEGFLMTAEERKKVVEIVIEQTAKRVPVIAHIGTIDTNTAMDLAKHAYITGADAISSVPPFYYRFEFNEIYNYYKDLASSVPIPLIIYNIPATTGVEIGLPAIKKLAEIDNVMGIKYTSFNHYDMQRISEYNNGRITVFSGADEMCVSGLIMGAVGLIGSFYNLMPDLYVRIYKQVVEKKDIVSAQKNLLIANDIIQVVLKYGTSAAQIGIKPAMKFMGIDCGTVRKPLKRLNAEDIENMKQELLRIKEERKAEGISLLDALR